MLVSRDVLRKRILFSIPRFETRNFHPMNYPEGRCLTVHGTEPRWQVFPGVSEYNISCYWNSACTVFCTSQALSSLLFRQKSNELGKHSALQKDSASPSVRRQQVDLCDDSQAAGPLSLWMWELMGPKNILTWWQNNITASFGDTHGVMQNISAACDQR